MKKNTTTHLFHCTSFTCLCKILSSGELLPSYCLERASYLDDKSWDFAFAMVCFADLLDSEVNPHMQKFNKDSYLRLSKRWARKMGVSNVIYYEDKTALAIAFKHLFNIEVERLKKNNGQMTFQSQMISLMSAFLKQYEGYYWNDREKRWSDQLTMFYTEREWRYVPLVQNKEDYYLSREQFLDETVRQEKRKELIEHGYTLRFRWEDIEEIGVKGFRNYLSLLLLLNKQLHIDSFDVLKKLKWIR